MSSAGSVFLEIIKVDPLSTTKSVFNIEAPGILFNILLPTVKVLSFPAVLLIIIVWLSVIHNCEIVELTVLYKTVGEPELASKMTKFVLSGTVAPDIPPEFNDQLDVLFQLPLPPVTQYLAVCPQTPTFMRPVAASSKINLNE